MSKYFKDRSNLKVALEAMWRLTPSPASTNVAFINSTMAEYRRKAEAAIYLLLQSWETPKSWLRKESENWLGLNLAWCRIAITELIRCAICQGASQQDISAIAASVPAIPVAKRHRRKRGIELMETILKSRGNSLAALAAAVELHAILEPGFDISDFELFGTVVSDYLLGKIRLALIALMLILVYGFRIGIVLALDYLLTALGVPVIGLFIGYYVGRLLAIGRSKFLAREATKTYAMWQVTRKLKHQA